MPKRDVLKSLQYVHLTVFLVFVTIIFLLHLITSNFLDVLRFPNYFKAIDPFALPTWPSGFHFYHVILALLVGLPLINALGLVFAKHPIYRIVSDLSSFLGFLILWPTALFFIFTLSSALNLTSENIQSSLIFFGASILVFILDLITWYFDEESLLKISKR